MPHIESPRIPVIMVCGACGSGKSTYVLQHAKANDLIIDMDAIKQRLSGLPMHSSGDRRVLDALIERNHMLRSLATNTINERAWFIIAAPDSIERQHWADMLHASVVVLKTPLDECIRRINSDPTRRLHRDVMIAAARAWHAQNRSVMPDNADAQALSSRAHSEACDANGGMLSAS